MSFLFFELSFFLKKNLLFYKNIFEAPKQWRPGALGHPAHPKCRPPLYKNYKKKTQTIRDKRWGNEKK
jgi:hypothetical protein